MKKSEMTELLMQLTEENTAMKVALDYLYREYVDCNARGFGIDRERTVLELAGYTLPEAPKKEAADE